jgi:antitoxin component YwqK of YwqJK toxin-antitoxin module
VYDDAVVIAGIRRALLIAFVLMLGLAGACKRTPAGPCGEGQLQGDAPPKGTLQWCTDANGIKNGPYREWWPSGQLKTETTYKNGHQHGAFASYYENGKGYERGTLTDGLRTGRWEDHYETGALRSVSEYGAGGPAYRYTLYRQADGTKWVEGAFKADLEHGHFIEYYPDGKKTGEGDFFEGKKTGTWTYWETDGSVATSPRGAF